jgi:hypothetical protein
MTGTDLCVSKSQFVPVIFEPPCITPRKVNNMVPCKSNFMVKCTNLNHLKSLLGIRVTLTGALEKLRKATINFVTSVSLSVRMEQLDPHWSDFDKNLIFRFFEKSSEKILV